MAPIGDRRQMPAGIKRLCYRWRASCWFQRCGTTQTPPSILRRRGAISVENSKGNIDVVGTSTLNGGGRLFECRVPLLLAILDDAGDAKFNMTSQNF